MDRERLPTVRRREALRRHFDERAYRLREEARRQGGPDDMHDDPAVENRLLFEKTDLPIREPDAIRTAEEIEAETMNRERRMHRDRDNEVIDDIRELERQDFEVV